MAARAPERELNARTNGWHRSLHRSEPDQVPWVAGEARLSAPGRGSPRCPGATCARRAWRARVGLRRARRVA